TSANATEVRALAQRAEAIGETLGDVLLQAAAQYYLIYACHVSGDYRATEDVCRRQIQSLDGERSRERFRLLFFPAVQARECLARALAERGEFDEASAQAHDALRMAEGLDHHPFSLTWAYLSLGYVYSVKGELGQALHRFERAAALCREVEIALLYP